MVCAVHQAQGRLRVRALQILMQYWHPTTHAGQRLPATHRGAGGLQETSFLGDRGPLGSCGSRVAGDHLLGPRHGTVDLDCGDVPYKKFRVVPPDPHGFDRDGDGIGCES